MESKRKTILFMGDQTDPFIDEIDYITKRATHTPWLKSFMRDLCHTYKAELQDMEPAVTESLGNFQSLQELANRYRGIVDETGVANAILIHAVRAAMLLQCVKREPHLLTKEHRPEWLGISGGILSLSALAVAKDFESLYDACLWVGGLICRICRFCYLRSRAVEDRAGTWGWAIVGISKEQLRTELDQFQKIMGIPEVKRAHVAISGDRWNTIIGPPSVLKQFLSECPAVNLLPKNELNIHSLQHSLPTSPTDLDYLVGNSATCDITVDKGSKIWGTDEASTEIEVEFGQFLRPVLSQALSRPLDVVKVVDELKTKVESCSELDIKVMGPSSHLNYLASALKSPRRQVNIHPENSSEPRPSARRSSGRIAVVGMAGRGPGCDNLDEFWNIISEGRDMHQEIPKDRFDIDEYFTTGHEQNKQTPQCAITSRFGCFIDKPGNFDARFFRISPREALFMDPGHRQFLMSACDALETAGYSDGPWSDVDPRRIGVFYGQSSDDWHNVAHHLKGCDAYTLQGSQRAFGAGRLAFHMNWEGPTYSVDSACASTLSCLHLACLSLLSHDIDMAVTGAANIIGYPHTWSALSKAGILSKTGNCKTFRDDADGYCRADFVGSVVLKRLEDAVDHNDNILAVMAGTGRNHSGNSPSITTSDAAAQEQLFRNVLEKSGVLPDEISYVEMHGTGTQIGDPAEMTAVTNVFSGPLMVGSIKANIGHSEAAAGMSSLLKSILMFEKNIIPPQAGMPHRLNPKLDRLLQSSKMTIPTATQYLNPKSEGELRHILINNFDAAGGNSCLLLEDPGRHLADNAIEQFCDWSSHVIVTTAKTPSALKNGKRNLLKWLRGNPDARIQDVAYTTNARRKHHHLRSAYVASSTQDLIAQLEANESSDDDASKPRAAVKRPVVFMFTGQGSHYAGMGTQLYRTSRTFRQKVDHCAQICANHGFPSFSEIIIDEEANMSTADPVQVQLAVITLEIALAAIWTSDAGLEPSMVIGHSLGEYAALHVAGVLSLVDVLYLVGHRALLLARLCEADSYSMLAVSGPTHAIQAWLDTREDSSCSIACTNSPRSTVIAGTREDIEKAQEEATKTLGARTKLLPIPYAFHSCQMDPLMKKYKAVARRVTFSAPKVPFTSTLLASVCDSSTVFDAGYLWRQTREQCRFSDAVRAAGTSLDDPVWLEIGPTQVLGSFVLATLSPTQIPGSVMSALESGKDNWKSLSKCFARLTEMGIDIDWRRLYAPYEKGLRLLRLPTYSWDLQDFWITHTEAKEDKLAVASSSQEPRRRLISTCAQRVLKEKSTQDGIEVTLQSSTAEPGLNALIRGHRVRGVGICPGSVFVDAAVAATRYLLEPSGKLGNVNQPALAIRNLMLNRPLGLDSTNSGEGGQLITTATSKKQSEGDVSVSFRSSEHALGSCTVTACDGQQLQASWNKMSHFIRSRMNEVIRSSDASGHKMQSSVFYALFSNTVQYDAAFKCVKKVYVSEDFQEGAAEIVLQQDPAGTTFASSPYVGESLVHLAGFVLNTNPDRPRAADTTFIMSRVESLEQPDPRSLVAGKTYMTFVHVSRRERDEADCDVYVFDADAKHIVMQCSGLRFHETANRALDQLLGKSSSKVDLPPPGSFPDPTQQQTQSADRPKVIHTPDPVGGVSSRATVSTAEGSNLFEAILRSISTQTGTDMSGLRDDIAVADLGVDSIMAIEITSDVRREGGSEFPPSFLTDYPTIGDLRHAFARPGNKSTSSSSENLDELSESQPVPMIDSGSSSDCEGPTLTPDPTPGATTPAHPEVSYVEEGGDLATPAVPRTNQVPTVQENESNERMPPPTARIMLLHGNPKSGHTPLYLIADGTGSIATYLHLNPLQSNTPVYGIDSPFSRAPDKVKAAGVTGIATIMVEALVKARSDGPFIIGGFSGGAMLAYEVSRQLADAGRQVDGLLLIDMACPRSDIDSSLVKVTPEAGFDMFHKMASQDAFWSVTPSSLPMRHLLAFFEAVGDYHPEPMTAAQRPRRCAVIWAEKGLIGRCAGNPQLRQELVNMGFPVEPYAGFMRDPGLGAIAWGVPDKRGSGGALGPNGWDEYVGGGMLCKSVDADHLEMLMPGHVDLLQGVMEEAVAYFEEST